MRVVLEVKDSEWDFLPSLLKRFEFVRVQQTGETGIESKSETAATFNATQLDTNGFTFNREEANER